MDQLHVTITMTDTDMVGIGHSPILTDTAATAAMIPTEDAAGYIVGTAENITRILGCSNVYIHHSHSNTPHRRSSSHRSSSVYS